jgi:mannose-1-phosphate guanylyltransferase/phosphomannomutase
MDVLDERFLVISGDVLTDIDLTAIMKFHEHSKAMATIGLIRVDNPLEFGIVITHEDGSIERFLEKPTWGEVFSDTINTGIFVLEPQIFDYIDADRPVDFSSEVFPQLLAEGKPLFGAVAEGYWEDVGTLEAYMSAHRDVIDGKVQIDVPGFEFSDGVWLGEGAEIHPDADIAGSAVIGPSARVGAGARIGDYTVLGSGVRVGEGADLERCVVHDHAYLGANVRLRGTVVGRSCDLRRGSRAEDGSVLGDQTFVGENAVITGGVKIYPFKTVEAGATVNSSIVWESKGARSLFGRGGVSGLANVDINPEVAARVAMAFATTLKKGSTVITSRDSSRSSRMLKRALMAGLNASGVNVLDLEVAPVPVTRFLVRQSLASGGVSVRLIEGDADSVILRFFDDRGLDISESGQRKIERLLNREDYRRVVASDIGDIDFPPRALEHYAAELSASVDTDLVRNAAFKLVVDYSYGTTSFVMPNVLAKLGAEVLGVNPYASTERLLTLDRDERLQNVATLVRASGAQLGAVIEPDGERIRFVDDEGDVVDPHRALLAFVSLMAPTLDGGQIALPVWASRTAEQLAEAHGASVLWTRTSTPALMDAATQDDVGFAGSIDGGYVVPRFHSAFDAAGALVKMLELLAGADVALSTVLDAIPRIHVAHEQVVTPWEQKGLVMRSLVEMNKDRDLVLIDGVKVMHDDSWVLALPDPEEPITHFWAESTTDSAARRLAQEYARRVRQQLR